MDTIQKKSGRKPYTLPVNIRINWDEPNGVIAKQIGTTILTVMKIRARLGIPSLPRGRPSFEETKMQLELFPQKAEPIMTQGELFEVQEQIEKLLDILKK